MTHYTDKQIMIRAMPCPDCSAKPMDHCNSFPDEKSGFIKNHEKRVELFDQFLKLSELRGHITIVNLDHKYSWHSHAGTFKNNGK